MLFRVKRLPLILFCGLAHLACGQPPRPAVKSSGPRQHAQEAPGKFDYYVLALSWSPQHCSGPGGQRDRFQCAGERQFGFIVHGLWPQFERGYPENCSHDPGPDKTAIDATLPIMPSPGLMRHEWSKHGTCTGLTSSQYFAQIRNTFAAIRIPEEYRTPLKRITTAPKDIESKFVSANPGMTAQSVAVVCSNNGRFLQEVRLCLDKQMKPRPCSADVRDCRSPEIIMQPVR
ncbi:MAG: ribonuclease T [Acidobacteria bacterium]|nr:ribonuclease T [Acidobacteriota bacterium]